MEKDKFGIIVRNRRREMNMTLSELAEKIGTTTSTVSKWERGEVGDVWRKNVQALSKVLDIPIEKLFGFTVDAYSGQHAVKMSRALVYGSGNDFFSKENIIEIIATEKVGDIFAYKAVKNEIGINISAGDIILCERDFQAHADGLYLIMNDGKLKIGKLFYTDKTITFVSEDSPIIFTQKNKPNILGKIIEIRREVF